MAPFPAESPLAVRRRWWWLPVVQLALVALWWAWALSPPRLVPSADYWVEEDLPPLVFGFVLLVSVVALAIGRSPRGWWGWVGIGLLAATLAMQVYLGWGWSDWPDELDAAGALGGRAASA